MLILKIVVFALCLICIGITLSAASDLRKLRKRIQVNKDLQYTRKHKGFN